MTSISFRTCLVTGQKLPLGELLRFTIKDGKLVFDDKKPRDGRGGYVKNDLKVIEKLKTNPKLKGKICHFMKVSRVEV